VFILIPLYREKDNLIYKLHPFTIAFFIFAIFFLSLIFTHPVYLLSLLAVVFILIVDSGNFKEWKGYLKIAIPLVLIIIIINALFVRVGSTVIYSGPRLPFIGKVRITLEALAYGAGMGVRLMTIISIFCFYTYTVQPDRFMKLFSRFGNKTVFIVTLSIRLFPLMISDYRRIMEVQRCRGVKIDSGGFRNRIKNTFPIVSVLLLSSLERSFQQAESMYSRGYGSGKRTVYNRELWRIRDYMIIAMTVIAIIAGLASYIKGFGTYSYYPVLTHFDISEFNLLYIVITALIFPAILDWGWKKWPILKLKI
jgi:energy-coupling factor transport system permease protein